MAQVGVSSPQGPAGGPALVAFDFDGTLTIRDSFTAFLKWRAGPLGYAWRMAGLAPALGSYMVDRDRGRIKEAAARAFLAGVPRERLEADCEAFCAATLAGLLRPDAQATWDQWRDKGARLVIVTASPTPVVAPFARVLGAAELIGTEFAYDGQDRLTGGFATPNCRGPEKVRRLQARYGAGVRLEAAYGDTTGDREMLAIAGIQGYRVFKARPAPP
jgi:phosphatidylglycerophosphatase C